MKKIIWEAKKEFEELMTQNIEGNNESFFK